MTNATMRRGTPNASMACIARGSAASLDAVEKAMSAGSRTRFTNAASGMRKTSATGTSTNRMNTASAP